MGQVVLIDYSSNESLKNYMKHDQIYFVFVYITLQNNYLEVYIKVSNLKVQIHNGIFTIIIFLQILGPTCHLNQRCNKISSQVIMSELSPCDKNQNTQMQKNEISFQKKFFFKNSIIKLAIFHYNNEMASLYASPGKKIILNN